MYRSGDARKTMPEAVQSATEQLEQQSRAMGQGVEALRNSAGHRLGLTPQSARPLIIANAGDKVVDVGLAMRDGGVELRDPTDSEYRDLKVRTFNATASMATDGNMIVKGDALASKFRGDLGAANDGYNGFGNWHGNVSGDGANTQVDAAYILSGGNIRAVGNVNADVSVGAGQNVIAGGDVNAGGVVRSRGVVLTSDASLKTDVRDLDDPELFEQLRPRRYRRHAAPDVDELGFVAQELPLELQRTLTLEDGEEVLGYDVPQLLAVAVAEIKRQRRRIEALETKLTEQEHR